ncbi:major facilitator superfamily domain-containing protein [Desarmillaria tabescens]|uniref:Major facilitator superfamily domain-containing protein n=1 Tax=Armillaria tabescens TaxID=1929756 RepID=A0AA39NBI5_ARMTA|nr:major facilitator superfamily domain-containing protein [Desarmillaria tabescens]KAK0462564.1 major facilitator superfamily domain-containing protein [Desarmillaria tabescens]
MDLAEGSVDSEKASHGPDTLLSDEELRKVQRRIDVRIIPWLCITYLDMRIDINISNAAIINIEQGHGIKKQLHLSTQDWNWIVSCFFYPHAAFELVSTLLMKRTTWTELLDRLNHDNMGSHRHVHRIRAKLPWPHNLPILGAAEAGYYPCVIYYLAFWFRPEEPALRVAAFHSFGQVSGFIGGFLAFAISYADGVLAGWRWLFIIGKCIPAILMGEREQAKIIDRLSRDAPSKEGKTWDKGEVLRLFADPTFWTFSAVWFCHAVGGFGLSYVLPTVIYELGSTTTALSNVLSMAPSLSVFVLLNTLGWLIQKRFWNSFQIVMGRACGVYQYHLLYNTAHRERACGALLCTARSNCNRWVCVRRALAKPFEAARGTSAAGMVIGITNAIAQFPGILGLQVFSGIYGPSYKVSFSVCVDLLAGAVVWIGTSAVLLHRLWGDGRTGGVSSKRSIEEVK